jgi:hypothetical protein
MKGNTLTRIYLLLIQLKAIKLMVYDRKRKGANGKGNVGAVDVFGCLASTNFLLIVEVKGKRREKVKEI